ncbi:hypothetical protein BXZ70DRAFT_524030 [Cristinia sonorae]|uniref:Uncharacterized protein n=1 Tax=Cristinia sonorae TaxID=1940300 RepID=A0A8K0UWE5_9AGAR|nr:hypothetical protein BXZ70DRAFT_524030 [Cristinia sonorae]
MHGAETITVERTEVSLPDELIEPIILYAWLSVDFPSKERWRFYHSMTSLARRWRAIMLAIVFSKVFVESVMDIQQYNKLMFRFSSKGTPPTRDLFTRSHVYASIQYAQLVAVIPDCFSLEFRVGIIADGHRLRFQRLEAFKQMPRFPSLTRIAVVWPHLPVSPSRQGSFYRDEAIRETASPAFNTVTTLSLHYPPGNDLRTLSACLPMLAKMLPNITVLELKGPIPLTHIINSFAAVKDLFLDTPRPVCRDVNRESAPIPPPSSVISWTITAAVKSLQSKALRRIVLLGNQQQPAGWERLVEVCENHQVSLEHKAIYY